MFFAASQRLRRRGIADQARAMSLAIAGAFGEDISAKLKELDE